MRRLVMVGLLLCGCATTDALRAASLESDCDDSDIHVLDERDGTVMLDVCGQTREYHVHYGL